MKEDYGCPQIKNFIDKGLETLEVDDKYKPIISDILLRRTIQYEFSPKEVKEDIETLLKSLKCISIEEMPDGYETALGLYTPLKQKITIGKSYAKDADPDKLYETLTHETYHALTHDENGNDRLESWNRYSKQYNGSLLEAFVEKAAYRTVLPENKDNLYFNHNSDGYEDITFIVDMIEGTYGVSEQELLKHGIRSRDELAKFLAKSGNETVLDSESFLDSLELNYARLHRALYPSKGEELSDEEKGKTIEDALGGINIVCQNKLRERIEKMPKESKEQAGESIGNLKFDLNKLNVITNDRIQYFSKTYSNVSEGFLKYLLTNNSRITEDKLSDMEEVMVHFENFESPEEALRILNWAANDHLGNYEDKEKVGISMDRKNRTKSPLCDIPTERIEQELDNEKYINWGDNSAALELKSIVERQDKLLPTVAGKMSGIFRKLHNLTTTLKDKLSTTFNFQNEDLSQNQEGKSQTLKKSSIFEPLSESEQEEANRKVKEAVDKTEQSKTKSAELEKEDDGREE